MGISAGETKFPRWDMPRSCNTLVARIVVFYMLSIIMITILVPHNDPLLLGTSTVAASPFVIAMTRAGIKVLPDIVNVIILIGLCAIGSESLFISSRVMTAMARMKLMPQVLGRVDKKGRPYVSLIVTALSATACTYINCANTGAIIFTWFSSISSTVYFLAWMTISVSNWQMHRAIKAQNDPAWQLKWAFKNKFGPTASIYLFVTSFLVLFATGYVSLYPIGGKKSVENFFQTFLAPPLFVVLYFGYKIIFKTKLVRPSEADLVSGRRPLTEADIAMLDAYAALPLYKRALSYMTISGDGGVVMHEKKVSHAGSDV
jgi:amino acid transporter